MPDLPSVHVKCQLCTSCENLGKLSPSHNSLSLSGACGNNSIFNTLKIQCLAPSQHSINIACTKICMFTTLFCLQRKLSHTDAQKNPRGAEDKTGGKQKSKVRLTRQLSFVETGGQGYFEMTERREFWNYILLLTGHGILFQFTCLLFLSPYSLASSAHQSS